MKHVTIKDNCFSHTYSCGNGDLKILSNYIKWDRQNLHDTIFYTDGYISSDFSYLHKNKINVAWIIEPKEISRHLYSVNYTDWNKFDYVLSHNMDFVTELNNSGKVQSLWYAFGGCWIYEEDRHIFKKSKNLSIISSGKKITHGHRLRHEIINMYRENFTDILGGGYNPINYKLSALKDYRFSVIIENDNSNDFFSEKLIDCLVTGTIPVYYGTKNIGKYFDLDGFIVINDVDDFNRILPLLNEDYYNSKINAIKNNFDLSHQYVNMEDWIYLNLGSILFNT